MERKFLSSLDYDLLVVTPHAVLAEAVKSVGWLRSLGSSGQATMKYGQRELIGCVETLLDLSIVDTRSLDYSPALLTLTAFSLCTEMFLGSNVTIKNIVSISQGYSPQEIEKLKTSSSPWWRDAALLAVENGCENEDKFTQCRNWLIKLIFPHISS